MLIIHLLKQKEEKEEVTEINKMTNYDNVSVLFSRFILNDKMIKCIYCFVSPTISDVCSGKNDCTNDTILNITDTIFLVFKNRKFQN